MDIGRFNIAEVFDHHARTRPDVPAVTGHGGALSHADLARLIRQSADHLLSLGASMGGRVGVCLGDTAAHLVCLLALARIGAIAVPMDVRWSVEEKARMARALGVSLVLVEADDAAAGALAGQSLSLAKLDDAWDDAVAALPGVSPIASEPDLPFIFALSSGTTSAPKGPLLSHSRMLHRFLNQYVTLTLNGRDRFLAATPLYFGATRAFCLSTLFAGGTVILAPPPLEPAELAGTVNEHSPTAAFLVPTQLRRLLQLDDGALAPFREIRVLISSGSALHPDEAAAVRGRICANLYDYYGTTEGGGISILGPEDRASAMTDGAPPPGLVGRPVFMVEVEIVDDEDRPLPAGEIGRVRYRGPGVATDDWFYPGDLGRIDPHGFLYLEGRAAETIIRGGVNIYPREIEEVLMKLDGVRDAAAIGWPSKEFGEEVAAFVVAADQVSDADLLACCRAGLARYKIPAAIFRRDSLPRTASGKLRREALRAELPPR